MIIAALSIPNITPPVLSNCFIPGKSVRTSETKLIINKITLVAINKIIAVPMLIVVVAIPSAALSTIASFVSDTAFLTASFI